MMALPGPPSPSVRVTLSASWHTVKMTEYFQYMRRRPDRTRILDAWIEDAIHRPLAQRVQDDGRLRRWVFVAEEQRFLRVVLLADGETVHNAFFDRGYQP